MLGNDLLQIHGQCTVSYLHSILAVLYFYANIGLLFLVLVGNV